MGLDPYVVLGSAVVGLLVGLTGGGGGGGGGALLTPMLILLFHVKPTAAIPGDLVAAVVMRSAGSLVHMRRGTVNFRLAGWLCAGSVPMAFLGAYLLHLLGGAAARQQNAQTALGAALLAGTAAMVLRCWLDRRSGQRRTQGIATLRVRPLVTVAIGAAGGVITGMKSAGVRIPDHRGAAVQLPGAGRRPASRHGPDPGGSAHRGGGARRAGLRAGGVRAEHRRGVATCGRTASLSSGARLTCLKGEGRRTRAAPRPVPPGGRRAAHAGG